MRGIKLKLVILYIVLVFIVMLTTSTFILLKFKQDESDKGKQDLEWYTRRIKEQIIDEYKEEELFQLGFEQMFQITPEAPLEYVEAQNPFAEFQASILLPDGNTVVAYTSVIHNYSVPTIISAVNGVTKFEAWRQDVDSQGYVKKWFELATPVYDDNGSMEYIVFVRSEATDSEQSLANMTSMLIVASVIAMVLTAIIGVLFADTLTAPIINLNKKATELADGNLNVVAQIEGKDEIGDLTKSFNEMAQRLKITLDTISSEKDKVEIVLNNMTDGVVAYDNKEELLHANAAAYDILGDVKEYSMQQLTTMLQFNELEIQRAETEMQEKTIMYRDKYINVSLSMYGKTQEHYEGVIIVVQDVTKSKKLDEMRKDFVANVSHEIRTPLTTIKTYAETLRSSELDDKEMAFNFLGIIESETDRMTLLADDLLELSKLDNQKLELNFKKENIVNIINKVIKQNEIMAGQKQQTIIFDEVDEKIVYCDAVRINQVFNNILSNSIKYSKGAGNITISIKKDKKYYHVSIQDQGIGMDKADIDRIFERFYRVDKARSREMGGTGLGLAITKQIVMAHSGKIKVDSEVGKGTVMTVSLLRS